MLIEGRGQVIALEVEAGAECVFTQSSRRDITVGADDGGQALALRGLRQPGDLATNAFERQFGTLWKTLDLGGTGQDHHGGTGQQIIAAPGLPLLINLAQFQDVAMGQPLDVRRGRLPMAQRWRMHPATFREE
ncbi:hypothetical protein D3C86_1233570 [compost metagenome]